MTGKGGKKVVSGLHKASKGKAKPRPRVITAPDVVQVPLGTVLVLSEMGISATGVGPLFLAPSPPQKPKAGTYDVKVFAKSEDPMWLTASVPMQLVVLGPPRTLTGALTGSWVTGDTLQLPPAGLTLSEGPAEYRVLAPPGGVFLRAGTIPVSIEAVASGRFAAVRWDGTVTVDKGTPTIAWTVPPKVLAETVVGGTKLYARITPSTLDFQYTPPRDSAVGRGEATLVASRAADADYVAVRQSVVVVGVGAPGRIDNPLDLDTVAPSRASPDVGGMSTEQLAKAFAEKTPDEVCNELNRVRGIRATTRQGRSAKVTMLDVEDRRPGFVKRNDDQRLTAIEFHQGGGIHGATPYVRVSTTKGKIKIVQQGYDPHGEKPIEVIYIEGS